MKMWTNNEGEYYFADSADEAKRLEMAETGVTAEESGDWSEVDPSTKFTMPVAPVEKTAAEWGRGAKPGLFGVWER